MMKPLNLTFCPTPEGIAATIEVFGLSGDKVEKNPEKIVRDFVLKRSRTVNKHSFSHLYLSIKAEIPYRIKDVYYRVDEEFRGFHVLEVDPGINFHFHRNTLPLNGIYQRILISEKSQGYYPLLKRPRGKFNKNYMYV